MFMCAYYVVWAGDHCDQIFMESAGCNVLKNWGELTRKPQWITLFSIKGIPNVTFFPPFSTQQESLTNAAVEKSMQESF